MTHLTNYQMYAMRLDPTLYACGTGRHLKVQLYHSHRHLNTRYYGRLRWIYIS